MTFVMSVKMALSSVWSSKIRSFLTMLGIIIGVAAVILLVSMVSASTQQMKTQLESMGTNLINVNINRGWGSAEVSAMLSCKPSVMKIPILLHTALLQFHHVEQLSTAVTMSHPPSTVFLVNICG